MEGGVLGTRIIGAVGKHRPSGPRFRLAYYDLFTVIVALLPFWGFAALPVGSRGIQIAWLVALLAGALFLAEFCVGTTRILDPPLTLLVVGLNVALLLSLYRPLVEGGRGMVLDWTTTYMQYVVGLSLMLVLVNLRPTALTVRRILRLHLGLAACVAAFGCVQFIGSAFGLDLNLTYFNPSVDPAVSAYAERTGNFARSTGLFSEPRQFGAYLVGALVVSLGLRFFGDGTERERRRLEGIALIVFLGLVTSLSASAYLTVGLLLVAAVPLVMRTHRGSPALLLLGATAPILAIVAFVMYSDHVLAIFVRSKLRPPDLVLLWEQLMFLDVGQWGWFRYIGSFGVAIRTWLSAPVFGVGLNNLEYYQVGGLSGEFTGAFGPVRFLAETGTVGFLTIAVLAGVILFRLLRLMRKPGCGTNAASSGVPETAILLFVSIFIRSLATNLYAFPSFFFWVEIGLVLMLLKSLEPPVAAPTVVRQESSSE